MKQLTFVNALGAEIVFTNSAPFLLERFSENEGVNISSSKGVNQDGTTYSGNTLEEKDIILEVAIIASSEEEFIRLRNRIYKVFNPQLDEGTLFHKDLVNERKIKCILNKKPSFTYFDSCVSRCQISLTANNPHWLDLTDTRTDVFGMEGDFEFPWEIPIEGIELSHQVGADTVNVINAGDAECGLRIILTASDAVVDPTITNLTTGEYITLEKSLVAGEVITITTALNNKKVESLLAGVTTNAFNYIEEDSTFFALRSGDNLIQYDAVSGKANLSVVIYHRAMYLGV